MNKNLEVILDTNPSGGCGCNCGCGGASVVEDMNDLVENLKKHNFNTELAIDVLPISDFESEVLINKLNTLLSNTNAAFRVDNDNIEETLSNILPIIVLDGAILTAYGVPTLNDVIVQVEKSL
ncbi:hypothetical protein OAO42_01445 [Candidatus Izimaplasma bacterium]|nr:hypothetical protein [Candidatus Izimaplasma bacterium]